MKKNYTDALAIFDKILQIYPNRAWVLDNNFLHTIKFILAPYLMNIRKLSRLDAYDAISTWLNECDSICKLRFDVECKINEALDMVKDYLPRGFRAASSKEGIVVSLYYDVTIFH